MLDKSAAAEVRRRNLTYLGPEKFASLYTCIEAVQNAGTPGDFTEYGVALGGSGICLSRALDANRRYLGFDVFGMIPPPSEADGADVQSRYRAIADGKSRGLGGNIYYGYIENLYDLVKENFASFGCNVDGERIILVKGLFQDTLSSYEDIKISIAHIDCDWYEPVSCCLNYAWKRLSGGGFIILDDYNDWSGCKRATDEFVSSNEGAKVLRYNPHAVIVKST